jgi:fatty acid desaturase
MGRARRARDPGGARRRTAAARLRRPALVACSVLLLVFAALGAASIGLFYLPAAVAMVVAAALDARSG